MVSAFVTPNQAYAEGFDAVYSGYKFDSNPYVAHLEAVVAAFDPERQRLNNLVSAWYQGYIDAGEAAREYVRDRAEADRIDVYDRDDLGESPDY